MSAAALAVLLQATVATAAAHDSYDAAYRDAVETGRPLVVLIGADFCPACKRMKHTVLPEVRRRGGMNNVAFAHVDSRARRDLARRMMRGSYVPQLVMFVPTGDKWVVRRLDGAKSVRETTSFLEAGYRASIAGRRGAIAQPASTE